MSAEPDIIAWCVEYVSDGVARRTVFTVPLDATPDSTRQLGITVRKEFPRAIVYPLIRGGENV